MRFTIDETNKVKGVAICLLIFHHLYRTIDKIEKAGIATTLITKDQLADIAVNTRLIVWVFAFLSAYGLSIVYAKSKKNFVSKRYFRLMNPYWFTIVVIWLLAFIIKDIDKVYSKHQLVYRLFDFFALSDLMGTPKVSGVFWYMSFAIVQVLVFPLLYNGCKKYGWLMLPVSAIVLLYLKTGIYSQQGGAYRDYLLMTELGILFAQYQVFEQIPDKERKIYLRIIEFLLFLIAAYSFAYLRNHILDEKYSILRQLSMSLGALCLIIGVFVDIRSKYISNILIYLGRYSGFMFLTHSFFIDYARFIYFSGNVIVTWLLCILLTLLSAILLKYMSEKSGYNALVEKVSNKVCGLFNKYLISTLPECWKENS